MQLAYDAPSVSSKSRSGVAWCFRRLRKAPDCIRFIQLSTREKSCRVVSIVVAV